LIGPLMIPFQIAGPPLAGWIFDTRGSYDLAIWVFMASTLAAGGAISLLRLPQAGSDAAEKSEGLAGPEASAP